MRIAVGSDHRGVAMRAKLVAMLGNLGQEVFDMGAHDGEGEYPDIAALVAKKVSADEAERGILICGTGIGMCIAANKFPGVRAAPCYDDVTAELSRRYLDLNVLCLPGEVLSDQAVDRLLEVWLRTEFDGGRHTRRIEKIAESERGNGHA